MNVCRYCRTEFIQGKKQCVCCFAPVPEQTPVGLIVASEKLDVDEMRHFQDTINAYYSDNRWKQKQIVLPYGTTVRIFEALTK